MKIKDLFLICPMCGGMNSVTVEHADTCTNVRDGQQYDYSELDCSCKTCSVPFRIGIKGHIEA